MRFKCVLPPFSRVNAVVQMIISMGKVLDRIIDAEGDENVRAQIY